MARVFLIGDFEESLTKLFRDDRAIERAINFTVGFAAIKNVLGNSPGTNLDAWSFPDADEYRLSRTEPWDASYSAGEEPASGAGRGRRVIAPKPADRAALDTSRIAHPEIETMSLIRIALWDRAGWSGTAFVGAEDDSMLLLLAPIFRGAEAAGEISRLLAGELGDRDEQEKLHVSIIRGVSRSKPLAYQVVIGSNPNQALAGPKNRLAVMISRVNTMEPTTTENLDRLLRSFRSLGLYGLAYCTFESDPRRPLLVTRHVIAKRELNIREAWEIGINDEDSVGILPSDDPILPNELAEAPVVALLSGLKSE